MMRFCCASDNHLFGGRKRAAVCSIPPSCVGWGITMSASKSRSASSVRPVVELDCEDEGDVKPSGRK